MVVLSYLSANGCREYILRSARKSKRLSVLTLSDSRGLTVSSEGAGLSMIRFIVFRVDPGTWGGSVWKYGRDLCLSVGPRCEVRNIAGKQFFVTRSWVYI